MNKIIGRILFFCGSFVLILAVLNIEAKGLNENIEDMSFAVLSDIHISESDKSKGEKLNRALGIINKKIPNIDKYIFTGDYTNRGFINEYNLFNEIYYKNVKSKEKRIILMGNHDYWNELDINSSKNRFENEMKKELYGSEKIKCYTFIYLSTENDYLEGYYSEQSLNFAKQEIEKSIKEDVNRPIFIFTHHPPKDTIYGSDVWGNSNINEAFNEYPQVVLFAGHTHFPLNDERGIYQENYTIVAAGAIGGVGLEEGTIEGKIPRDAIKTSQGLIVKVNKDNKVIITKMDFLNNEEIKDPWVIDSFNKINFRYMDKGKHNKEPYFMLSSIAKIRNRRCEDVNIVFNQGKDDDMVHSYKIYVYEKSYIDLTKDYSEKLVQEHLMFSKFYLGSKMPDKLNFTISNIKINKEYVIKIYAIDSFGNISLNPLICDVSKI